MRRAWVFLFLLGCSDAVRAQHGDRQKLRLLFVGNSYTMGCFEALELVFKGHELAQACRGGARLAAWSKDEALHKKIAEGRWDYVILQDQSQVPGLPGRFTKSFAEAVDGLVARIRKAKAEPVLFLTWGRRDGDPSNAKVFKTFAMMQDRLSAAYRAAAKQHGIPLVPVGEVFRAIHQADRKLFRSLYADDGSHPALHGAAVTAYAFGQVLLDLDPQQHAKGLKSAPLRKLATHVKRVVGKEPGRKGRPRGPQK